MESVIYKSLVFVSCISLVLANITGECQDIYDYLDSKNYELNLKNCTVNEDGKVTDLTLYTYCLTEEDVNKLISYNTIKNISFDKEISVYSTEYDSLKECGEIQSLPSSISNLSKLESLELHDFTNINENDFSKLPKSLKKLALGDVDLSQVIINEISSLNDLEELSLIRTKSKEDVIFEPIKKLKNLSSLYIDNSKGARTTMRYVVGDYLSSFTNLKKFEAREYTFSQESFDALSKLSNLKEITLTECGFGDDLELDSLKNLKKLEILNILGTTEHCLETIDTYGGNHCPLDEIPEAIFKLTNLKRLVINHQKEIDVEALKYIKNLKNLQYLDLAALRLNEVPESISSLKNLVYLNLEDNYLTEVPSSLSKLKNLQELVLSENNINTLPDELGNLNNLKTLNLRINNLTTLPRGLVTIKNLENLDLELNAITTIPENIARMKNLKNLNLNQNRLSELSYSIGALDKLETLNLSGNAITALPSTIGGLRSLKKINLFHNKLSTVPESIEGAMNLEILLLTGNQLESLPDTIGELKNLKVLNANSNVIKEIPASINGLKSIVNIDLSFNDLTTLPDAIGELQTLQSLNVGNNYIVDVPNTIGNLQELRYLILSYNKLEKFPDSLGDLKNITHLNLAYNTINDEIPNSLNDLPNLTSINLHNNVNIKGKTLTNESLDECSYGRSFNGFSYSLCMTKNSECFSSYSNIPPCEDPVIEEPVLDDCQTHVVIRSPLACRACGVQDYETEDGPCLNDKMNQTTHMNTPYCIGHENWTIVNCQPKVTVLTSWIICIIVGAGVLVICIVVLIIVLVVRNRRIYGKYQKLIVASETGDAFSLSKDDDDEPEYPPPPGNLPKGDDDDDDDDDD